MGRGLQLQFNDPASFRAEYAQNIEKGGAFVRTTSLHELRAVVDVEVVFEWCGESVLLEAEIVHCTPQGTDARQAGVAVQFLEPIAELRERLGRFAEADDVVGISPDDAAIELEDSTPDGAETSALSLDPEAAPLELDLEVAADPAPSEPGSDAAADSMPPELSLDVATDASRPELSLEESNPDPTFEHDTSQLALDPSAAAPSPAASGPELSLDEPASDAELELDESMTQPQPPPMSTGDLFAPGAAGSGGGMDPEERRKAPRETARVPIRIDSSTISLDGRTRDLSETGVLLSADASDLPVGKQVSLSLTHPNTGERLEINGTVARHITTGGTVAAVGIEFDLQGEAQTQVAEFIREVKAAESIRRETGISGVIEELGMVNLLQMFGTSSRGGTLYASSGAEEGVVAFENGSFRYARLGGLRGVKALARMLAWDMGVFEFQSHVDALDDEDEVVPLDAAILEAVRRMDETRRAESEPHDPRCVLRLHRDALGALDRALSQTEEAVLDLAAAGLTLRRLLDVIPEADAQILEAVTGLCEAGLVSMEPPA